MQFYIVDAFTQTVFGGNPAGVVFLEDGRDFPEEELMVKTAAELRYSETAFVKNLGNRKFQIRYFTPSDEVDLCGHATIGSFGALLEAGMVREGEKYELFTKAGQLEIEVIQGQVFMEMGTPVELQVLEDWKEVAAVLGLNPEDIGRPPGIVSTGLPDIMVEVKEKTKLLEMVPDFPAMTELTRHLDVVGIHAFALDGKLGVTASCRNFAPLYGIDEEAATGTANGALTFYLYNRGILKAGDENLFLQGESMGRPSRISSRLNITDKTDIRVGGHFALLAKGELLL